MLHKNGVIPLYIQLQNILKEDILQGKYKEGELIPSETVLSNQYNITRSTVRKAISNLIDLGFIRREHGKGSFVSLREVRYKMWNFGGFTEFMKKQNKVPYSEVLHQEMVSIEDRSYYKLVRARGILEDHVEYLTLDTSLLPLDLFPGLEKFDFSTLSLYDTLRKRYEVFPARVEVGVQPILSNKETQQLFKVDRTTPLLEVQGSVFGNSGVEIEKVAIVYSPKVEFQLMTSL